MRISLDEAIRFLVEGQVIGVPTETVYGLAASIFHPAAISKIFALKGRPSTNPLIIHVASVDQVIELAAEIPPGFSALADAFWPGPLTVVLPVKIDKIPDQVRAGLPTAAFRIPQHTLTRKLLEKTGPIVMPSANISGSPSATCAEHVENDFGKMFPVLDGGKCGHGLESTILIYKDKAWQIIRLGALPAISFKDILGYEPSVHVEKGFEKPVCPGQMFRHYAPKARLHLCQKIPAEASVVLGFSDRIYLAQHVFLWGDSGNPKEVAENLYLMLRELDEEKVDCAWVDMNFPETGLWQTIAERLKKAAAK